MSEYLGHSKNVRATINIKVGDSSYYFSVDRFCETTPQYQNTKHRKKTPSDYRRDHVWKNKYLVEKRLPEKISVKVPLISSTEFNDKNLLNCSFISDSPLIDDQEQNIDFPAENEQEIDPNEVSNNEVESMETDDASNEATTNNDETNQDNGPHSSFPVTTPISPLQTPPSSPMQQTSASDNFQDVRPRKNKQRNEKRTIKIIVCEKSEGSAKTQLKIAQIYLDKLLSCKVSTQRRSAPVSTSPVFLGLTPTGHFGFSIKVRSDRAEEAFKCIERGDLNSWKIVAARIDHDDPEGLKVPENVRHRCHCDYVNG